MRTAQLRTRCECQSTLVAVLDEQLNVMVGANVDSQDQRVRAPASRAFVSNHQVGVSFACPTCTRNVLRTFSRDQLVWETAVNPVAQVPQP